MELMSSKVFRLGLSEFVGDCFRSTALFPCVAL